MTSPLVLIVDDDERNQTVRKEQLEREDLQVVLAGSMNAALIELETGPEMDAILTDLSLDPSSPRDKSGLELVQVVRERFGDIPVFVYSARIKDDDLSVEEKKLVTRSVVKRIRPIGQVQELVQEIRSAALSHRESRRVSSEERRAELLDRHQLETIDAAETVRRLMPHSQKAEDIENSLREAGYHLELIHSSAFSSLATPVLVWVKQVENGVEAEVYGQSTLYSHGGDTADAAAKLVELMRLFAEDFRNGDGDDSGPSLRLREFLTRTIRFDDEET